MKLTRFLVATQLVYLTATEAAPSRIADLTVSDATPDSITLSWTSPASSVPLAEYDIRVHTNGFISYYWESYERIMNNIPTPGASGFAETMTVTNLRSNTRYYFAIKTKDSNGSSSSMSVVSELTALPPNTEEKNVTLAWDPNSEVDLAGYRLYHGVASRTYTNSTSTEVSAEPRIAISNLVGGVTYYFAVTAYNTAGLESDYSNEVSYTPTGNGLTTLTLDWTRPADIAYGTKLGSKQLNAKAMHNGQTIPGRYVYNPPSGHKLPVGDDQTLSVVFTPRDTNTFSSTTSSVLIDVKKRRLVISVSDRTKTYGRNMPTISPSYSGFASGDNKSVLLTPAIVTTSATAQSPVGTYVLQVGGATADNYAIEFQNGTLTVTPARLYIGAKSVWRYEHAPDPILTPTYSGLASWDTPSVLTPPVVLSTTATSDSPPGYYAIGVSGTANQNYTIAYREGRLRVVALTRPVVIITPAYKKIETGDTIQFTAYRLLTNGVMTDVTSSSTWQSSRQSAASISASGVATGLNVGTAVISATQEGVRGTTILTVVTNTESELEPTISADLLIPTTLTALPLGANEILIGASGSPGTMFILEKSPDMLHWGYTLDGMIEDTGDYYFIDSVSENTSFYRMIEISADAE